MADPRISHTCTWSRSTRKGVSLIFEVISSWSIPRFDLQDVSRRVYPLLSAYFLGINPHYAETLICEDLDRISIQRLCALLAQDRTLKEINFVIPKGFRNGDEDSFGGYDEDHDMEPESPVRLQKIGALDWIKKTVVVEEGGYLATDDGPRQIMDRGWDLVCLPGSFIWEKGTTDKGGNTDYEKHEVTETRTYKSPDRDIDHLIGVKELFEDEQVSIHANGGKHKRSIVKTKRGLKGFGGCRFIGSEGVIRQVAGC